MPMTLEALLTKVVSNSLGGKNDGDEGMTSKASLHHSEMNIQSLVNFTRRVHMIPSFFKLEAS